MFEQAFKNIDDVLWKDAGCTSELDYTEQTSWLLFLKYLDALEHDKATEAALDRKKYIRILDKPYRWESWAAPRGKDSSAGSGQAGTIDHNRALTGDDLIAFVNGKLFPYQTEDGKLKLDVRFEGDTVWLSLNQLAELFQRDKSVISRHIKNVFDEGELVRTSVVAESATTASDGKTYQVEFFNLDVIISVGYQQESAA